jgi:anaerobic magnesium-protoporphyrin IX monomethyl ester cyclase
LLFAFKEKGKMNILLTHGYFLHEDEKEKKIMRPYVPLGILYISAWLEKHGYENEVFDSTFSSFDQLIDTILKNKPRIVALYTNLMTKLNVLRIIRFINSSPELLQTRVVLGGPEVRNHADNFLQHGADYIVLGEGEESMLELTNLIIKGEGDISSIRGIMYRDSNNTVCKNAEREKMKDLERLPMPNRQKVNLQLYFDAWKEKHGTSSVTLNTMRGCPYSCKWCSRAVYGASYRRRSAAHVADEIAWIKENYSVDSFWFVDDVFTISHKWLASFNAELRSRDLKVAYECITRADRMNEEVIKQLKESGCFRVWIGAESGSQKVIDLMDRRVEVEQVRDMIQMAKRYGIQAGTFIMVGYPGETKEDIFETARHLKSADPDHFTITVAYPIKGTPLYEEVESRFIKKLEWDAGTDRDIDFKRTYTRRYYDYAVKMISNEVYFRKALKRPIVNLMTWPVFKLRSVWAQLGMKWQELQT